jgi:hydantoinase/carbamoylase family amidase
MAETYVPIDRVRQRIQDVAKFGALGPRIEDGYSRPAWGPEECAAIEYIRNVGEEAGLMSYYDAVGNLYLTTPGTPAPTPGSDPGAGSASGAGLPIIQVGSHIDTVPKGGTFDGAAGIIAGLEAIIGLKEYWGAEDGADLQLVVWRGEESPTFQKACKGSHAAFGLLDPAIVKRISAGKTMAEWIREAGFDPTPIAEGRPTLPEEWQRRIAAHLELHIEQARTLEQNGVDVGIATSIRGPRRFRVVVRGVADHSGATPMGPEFRRDANLAAATMQVRLHELTMEAIDSGEDLVETVGVVNCDPDFNQEHPELFENTMNRVSPFGYFTVDIRSNRLAFLDEFTRRAKAEIGRVAQDLGVEARIDELSAQPPIEKLSPEIQNLIEAGAEAVGATWQRMPSGALHDVAIVAGEKGWKDRQVPGGLVFIPCREGISHSAAEFATDEWVHTGAEVLAGTLLRAAAPESPLLK